MVLTRGTRFCPHWVLLIIFLFLASACQETNRKAIRNEDFYNKNFPGGPKHYLNLNASEKSKLMWEKGIIKTEFKDEELPAVEDINIISMIMANMNSKMDEMDDYIPYQWEKSIHRRSIVAKIKWQAQQPASDLYSGIFKNGADFGLIRLSLTFPFEKRGLASGVAIKIFRDQHTSANVSLLTSLEAKEGDNLNFFEGDFTHRLRPSSKLGNRFIAFLFERAKTPHNDIGVNDFAAINPVSANDKEVKAPSQIYFRSAHKVFLQKGGKDFRLLIKEHFKIGDIIFEVFDEKNNKIADIVLTSEFKASWFGDDQLFFRHERPSTP